jgi:hypothetical protein
MPDDPEPREGGQAPSPDERAGQNSDGRPGDESGRQLDQTREQPALSDDTAVSDAAAGDADTVVQPPADEEQTAVLPPPGVWSARAEVPTARPIPPGATEQWEQPPDMSTGRWWMPILIGIIGLLLLGVLGYGIWLITSADDDESPGPAPTRTTAPAKPTTKPPTTAPPRTTAPTTQAPAQVEVPGLAGESVGAARDRLDELGLAYRLQYERTPDEEPGTVIRTDPPEGTLVDPGTQVTLVIAEAPPVTEEPTVPPTSSPDGDGDGN